MSKLIDILKKSINYFEKKKIENSRIKVETIFSEVLGMQRIMLYANFEKELSEKDLKKIREKLNQEILKNSKNEVEKIFDKEKLKENSVKILLEKSINYLIKNNINEAKLISEIIFSNVLNIERMMLFTKYKEIIPTEKIDKIREYIQKIGKEKFPLQYLFNEQEFYGRKFYVDKSVLIPRQDTEILVENTIGIIKENKIENPKILDIGTGSGVIGITLALEINNSKVMGVDISDKALEVSEKNRKLLKAENIRFFKSDLFQNIEYKKFDMIVSNPPYISENEVEVMSDDALLHEPNEALFASEEGLYFYNEISRQGQEYLKEKGYLIFEVGYKQAKIVKIIMENCGYKSVEIKKDLESVERVVIGKK